MLLDKQAILSASDHKTEDVDVPEWGGTVRVRTMTGRERDAFEASLAKGEGKDRKTDLVNLRARLAGLCMVGEDGQRLFTDAEVEALGDKTAAALDRVFSVAQRLNGMTAQDVEDLAKNSGAAPSGDSTSA